VLKVELAAGRKLGRKLQQLLWKDMAHFEPPGLEFVIAYVLFLRAERTFSSIRTLARLRMVDDALALVRVMVEKVINAEYILLTGTDTALDYMQYQAFREWRDFEELQSVSPGLAPNYAPDTLEKLRNAHDRAKIRTLPHGSQKNRFGRGHDWIDIGLSKRAEIIDEMLMRMFGMRAKSTGILYHSTYKKGAVYVHGMWASLARSLEPGPSNNAVDEHGRTEVSVSIRIKDKDSRVAVQAVNAANLAAVAVILFVGKLFTKRMYLDWANSFTGSYIEALRKAKEEL
jgi:hypothetical protein